MGGSGGVVPALIAGLSGRSPGARAAVRKLAFLFRYIPVNERQLSRVAREAHSGVPFPLHLGKRTPVARVAHPCHSGRHPPAQKCSRRESEPSLETSQGTAPSRHLSSSSTSPSASACQMAATPCSTKSHSTRSRSVPSYFSTATADHWSLSMLMMWAPESQLSEQTTSVRQFS